MSASLIPLTEAETADYLAGHVLFPGAVETEHGVAAPAQAVIQAVVYDALRRIEPTDALDITAVDIADAVLARL